LKSLELFRSSGAGTLSGCGSGTSGGGSRRLPTSVSPRASNDRSRALRMPQANIENVMERSR